jgi:hypothetical protein
MVLKLLAQQTTENGKWKPLSIADIPLTADYHKVPDEILERTTTMVVAALQQQTPWQDQQVKIDDKSIALVNLAAMHLLWDWLHTQGQAELAHNIQPYGTSILQPARLQSADYGIAQRNQIFHDIGNDNEQLWIGHKRKSSSRRWKLSKVDNIITLLRKESEGGEFEISSILQGDNIKIFEDQIIVFRDGVVSIYKKPDKNNLGEFPLLWEFQCDIDTVEKVASFTTKTWWSMHRITGKKKNQDSVAEEKKVTLCFNREHPKLSYTTGSRRHIINGNAFTIDSTKGQIAILASWKIQKIGCRQSSGIVRLPNGEQYFEFTQRGLSMRLGFSDGSPVVSVERDSWWHIYENAVRDIIPHKNTFDIDKEREEIIVVTEWGERRVPFTEILKMLS